METFSRRPTPNNNRDAIAAPSWFQGAPLSKFIAMVAIVSHIAFEMGGLQGTSLVSFDYQAILFEGQIVRLFLYPITFASMGELVLGLGVLCPLMRRFEREMGTHNFASFLLLKCLLLSTILQCFISELFDIQGSFAPGPYPHIGTLLYLYFRYTPKVYPKFIGLFGFDFSEKSLTYCFAIQLLAADGWSSFTPAACGFLTGILMLSSLTPLARLEIHFPRILIRPLSIIGRFLGLEDLRASPPVGVSLPVRGGRVERMSRLERGGNRGMRQHRLVPDHARGAESVPAPVGRASNSGNNDVTRQQFQTPPPPPLPSPEAILQLTAMGFEREDVVRALQTTDNNVEAAANRLLSGS